MSNRELSFKEATGRGCDAGVAGVNPLSAILASVVAVSPHHSTYQHFLILSRQLL
jgi:hypothetical protein